MNILYLINYAGKGGSEKYVLDLASYAVSQNGAHNVYFIYNVFGELCEQMKKLGVEPVQMAQRRPPDFTAAGKVAAFCEKHHIDIIHVHFQRENMIALLAKKLYPFIGVIYTSHIIMPKSAIWSVVNRLMTPGDDAVIAVCTAARDALVANGFPEGRIRVVLNGVKAGAAWKQPKPGAPVQFLSVTRFSAEKDPLFLLNAVKALKTMTDKPFHVTFAGDGPLLNDAKKFVNDNDLSKRVTFLGYCQNTAALLEKSDVFVNSSRSEALSLAILEAMSAGLALIATEVGGNVDIVNGKTNCGLLVPHGTVNKLAEAMRFMMDNPDKMENFGNNSKKAIKQIFNLERVVADTFEIYEEARRKQHDLR